MSLLSLKIHIQSKFLLMVAMRIAPVEDIKQEPVQRLKVEQPIIDDPSGDYVHSQIPDATATVTKTETGYDIDWVMKLNHLLVKMQQINTSIF